MSEPKVVTDGGGARVTFIHYDFPNLRWRVEFQVGREQMTFMCLAQTAKWRVVGHPDTVISPELRDGLTDLVNDSMKDWTRLREYRDTVGELPPGITIQ